MRRRVYGRVHQIAVDGIQFELLEKRQFLSISPAAVSPALPAATPVWQGFTDSSAALGTNVYTFGSPGTGNTNYYDGDFGDFDQDGLIDRALISRYGLLWNTGDGMMSPFAGKEGIGQAARPNPSGFIFREAPDNPYGGLGDDAINYADIDNDGDLDLISGGNGETFAIQENISLGRFKIKSLDLGNGSYVSAWQIVNTDLERDGDVDLIVGSGYPIDYTLLVNDGAGNFTDQTATRNLNFAADPPEGTISGDVDGDGDYDVVVLKGDNRTTPGLGIIVAKNNGAGFFTQAFTPFAKTFPNLPDIRTNSDSNQAMSLGDIDNDGDLDLFIALGLFFTDHNLLNQTIGSDPIVSHAIFINNGTGNFVEDSAARFVGDYSGEILRGDNGELFDVDYDGDLDIVAMRRDVSEDIKQFQVFINDGTGHFTFDAPHSFTLPATGTGPFGNDVDVADLNGDGTSDVWLGLAGESAHILINSYADPSGLPADMPRTAQVVSANAGGITLSWQAPPFAATARSYKVYRSTSPDLALTERQLIKTVGERHQDEAFAAPITAWTTTAYLNDPDVTLNGANNEIRFIDRTARPGITYYYSVVHVGTENGHSRPTAEVSGQIAPTIGVDTTAPFLTIAKPTKDEWTQHPEIVLQYGDGGSGINPQSVSVSFDKPIGVFDQQVLVPLGSTWKYLDNGSNQQTAWRNPIFNDASWSSGPAKLGYGNNDDATTVSFGPNANAKYVTTYFRKQFSIADVTQLSGDLTVRMRRDDGAIVYVNGTQIGATNVISGAAYNTYATSEIPDAQENDFVTFSVSSALLNNNSNLISVELHQFNHAGADLGFDLELSASVGTSGGLPAGTNIAGSFLYQDDKIFIAPFEGGTPLPLGPITMTVSIADNTGNVTTQQRSFNVSIAANQPPIAVLNVTPFAPDRFALSANGSSDSDGTVTRFEWYFPDGVTKLGKDVTWQAAGPGIYEVELYVWDDRGNVAESELDLVVNGVAERHVFYNRSAFDGNNPASTADDDLAIATDKTALLPGQTGTLANYTSYSRGINGVMVDLVGRNGPLTAADFEFRMGNDNTPGGWPVAPAPSSITIRDEAGTHEADRVTLIWPDGAIKKRWLQVTMKANANTGLASPDVFYFGNAVGESGDSPASVAVNATDEVDARGNSRSFGDLAPIDFLFDFNRDSFVNATDQILARSNATTIGTALKLISPPALVAIAAFDDSFIAAGLATAASVTPVSKTSGHHLAPEYTGAGTASERAVAVQAVFADADYEPLNARRIARRRPTR